MSPIDDKDRRYMMSDDERASLGKVRPRGTAEPPKPPKPGTLEALFARIPPTWKALTLIAAIFISGVAGHSYMVDYTEKYATHDDLHKHTLKEVELREQIRVLRESDAARSADVASIKMDTAAVREDIRTLLQYMLNNPPARSAQVPKKGRTP